MRDSALQPGNVPLTISVLDEVMSFAKMHDLHFVRVHKKVGGGCTCAARGDCSGIGKHPDMGRSWCHARTSHVSKETVLGWLAPGPRSRNVGLTTGTQLANTGKYGLVIDVDDPASDLLPALLALNTFHCRTGGGGYHFWLQHTLPVRNSTSSVALKVDVRGLGGFVVCPPSQHHSGAFYSIGSDTRVIQNAPEWLLPLLTEVKPGKQQSHPRGSTTMKTPRRLSGCPTREVTVTLAEGMGPTTLSIPVGMSTDQEKQWGSLSCAAIRTKLAKGGKIPLGVRNTTLHRLLSSDRARGTCSRAGLVAMAQIYMASFRQPLSKLEVACVITSVMKYPTYNNSHERVNECYVTWLRKHGKLTENSNDLLTKLKTAEDAFFVTLKQTIGTQQFSLAMIESQLNSHVAAFTSGFAPNYKPTVLSKKLISEGFKRQRLASRNVWIYPVSVSDDVCYNETMTMQVSQQPTVVAPTNPTPTAITPQQPKITERKITVKVKDHPCDHKYRGMQSQEYFRAKLRALAGLSPADKEVLRDPEGFLDGEHVDDFMAELHEGDEVGIGYQRFKLVSKRHDGFIGHNLSSKDEQFVTDKEIDLALLMDYADILRRDGKLYGVPETREVTVKIADYTTSATPPTVVSTTPTTPDPGAGTVVNEREPSP